MCAQRKYGGAMMKVMSLRSTCCFWLSVLISVIPAFGARAGACAISDGSQLPSDEGCMLAFTYNQEGDHRHVVLDRKNRRQYESPLENSRMPPFWEGGKVYVIDHSGSVQGFSIGTDKLVPEQVETISTNVVRTAEYSRSQQRLYLICTGWDAQRRVSYELSATDFPAKKTLWRKKIDNPGLLRIMQPYVCVTGLKQVQVFNCDTGEKIGGIDAAKPAVAAHE
jgi:hypothetical protein